MKMSNLKGYRYIIYSDEYTDGEYRFSLSSQQVGYIDDHIAEHNRDAIEELIDNLPIGDETNSCTWYINERDIPEAERVCQEFGLTEDERLWF